MPVGIYLTFREFLKIVNPEVPLLGVLVPALGLLFRYSFAETSVLPLPVCKLFAIKSGILIP